MRPNQRVINAFPLPDTGNKNSPDHETITTPGIVNHLYLTNALKMARDYIAILDLSGKCLWANETMTNAMDPGDHGDLAGRNFALCIAPEYRKTALASLVEAKKTGYKTVPLHVILIVRAGTCRSHSFHNPRSRWGYFRFSGNSKKY